LVTLTLAAQQSGPNLFSCFLIFQGRNLVIKIRFKQNIVQNENPGKTRQLSLLFKIPKLI